MEKQRIIIEKSQLQEMYEKLLKWLKISPPEVMQILEMLKQCKISKAQLKAVPLHEALNKIAKIKATTDEHQGIVQLAKKVRQEWKKQLQIKPKKKKPEEGPIGVTSQVPIGGSQRKAIIQKPSVTGPDQLPNLNDNNRNRALKTFYQIFKGDESKKLVAEMNPDYIFSESKMLELAINVERMIWANAGDPYLKQVRNRILILKNKDNPALKAHVVLGNVSIADFITKEAKDLLPEELRKKMDEGKLWSMKANQSDFYIKNVEVKEGEFQCWKCGSRRIQSTQRQMRSADEPMTTFFFCVDCGNRWKMN